MLNAIGFDNYRVFDKETFLRLKPITILTGPNSSGKSSVLKAAKLLKQNVNQEKYSGPPSKLSFTLDYFHHLLSDYQSIINNSNIKKQNHISFIIPINLSTLGENYFCQLKYDTIKRNEVTLKEFTVFNFNNGSKRELFKLIGGSGEFHELLLDFALFKESLENVFVPLLAKIHERTEDHYENVMRFNTRNNLPGAHMLDYFTNNYKKYDSNKPVLPFYNFIQGNLKLDYDSFDSDVFFGQLVAEIGVIKEYYNRMLKEKQTNSNEVINMHSLFRNIEDDFFQFNNERKLVFAIDLETNEKFNTHWWRGILLRSSYSEDIFTPKRTSDEIFEFSPYWSSLIELFDLPLDIDYHNPPFINTNFFYDYIRYIVIESMEQCRKEIINKNFVDINRIEQVEFYQVNNTRIGYNLIHEFLEKNGYSKTDKISNSLKDLKIADSFEISILDFGVYVIYLNVNGERRHLSEFGYGVSKIFFLLLALNTFDSFYIEEPESSLHPNYQSKIADIIISYVKENKTNVIIETHSEYFIRKLQYLVASKQIESDQIIINYFNSPETREEEGIVKEINIQKDGSLSKDFGPGFFDEALNWKFELMKLKNLN
jgi:AAA15 family ATPase/GTPase